MTTLLLASLVLAAIASVVTVLSLRHSPEGFEDATGFHAVRISGTGSKTGNHDELHGDHFAGGLV